MDRFVRRRLALFSFVAVFVLGCSAGRENAENRNRPNPLQPLNRLLELHGLPGKQPEERTDADKKRVVQRSDLEPLILDLDEYDDFLSNLYVGFIVGAVARHQSRLYVSLTGERASVAAGRVRVILYERDGAYRISLKDSIPPEIVHRAKKERQKQKENVGY